jgi:ATP-dependent Zn protease
VFVAYQKAMTIINTNKILMEKLAGILFEKEYLSKEEFEKIMTATPEEVDGIIEIMRNEYRA